MLCKDLARTLHNTRDEMEKARAFARFLDVGKTMFVTKHRFPTTKNIPHPFAGFAGWYSPMQAKKKKIPLIAHHKLDERVFLSKIFPQTDRNTPAKPANPQKSEGETPMKEGIFFTSPEHHHQFLAAMQQIGEIRDGD